MQEPIIKNGARLLLGAFLGIAGIGHLTFLRQEFQAQVPNWVPLDKDLTVVLSGVAEVVLGSLLLFTPEKYRAQVGKLVALFFLAIFPGNISQYLTQQDAFGLNSDSARLIRLFFQPVLMLWALWSTKKE